MDYSFKGKIKLLLKKEWIPFSVQNGRASFGLRDITEIDLSLAHFELTGITDDNKTLLLLIERFVIWDVYHENDKWFVGAIVEACVLLDKGFAIDDIDSIGFHSYQIPAVTRLFVTGGLNVKNFPQIASKDRLAGYSQNGRSYDLFIGFVDNDLYARGQLLELVAVDSRFNLEMLRDSYITIKHMLAFLYQTSLFPLESIYLRKERKNVGYLFVEPITPAHYLTLQPKCIPIPALGEKLNALLQSIADNKLYLRYIPSFKEEELFCTTGRFLMALTGLENVLDSLEIHVAHSDKHQKMINRILTNLESLKIGANSDEKRYYKRFAENLEFDENLEGRIRAAILENADQIKTFYQLSDLGKGINSIAKRLADTRNALAHGRLDESLSKKNCEQMTFLLRFIPYLQLISLGFEKEEAATIIPHLF